MMRATAAVQVSVDAGDEGDGVSGFRSRWRLAHRLGPVLIAAFANSPLWQGRPTGWVSSRQAVWAHMDPGRTRPPQGNGDPRAAFSRYALDARLLCLRRSAPAPWTAPPDLPLRSWLRGARGERPPTFGDVDYHLTTLFPPVRPRGWLELRMIDAQRGDGWVVPVLLAATLLDDAAAADAAWEVTEPLARGRAVPPWDVWLRAARTGPADPQIGTAVRACFEAVLDALTRSDAPIRLRRAVADFADRYPLRGRCPADDRLDALRRGDTPMEPPEGILEGAS
jgi:gamma-glutamylcysteine synthetase